MYDIFYIGPKSHRFKTLQNKFPFLKNASSVSAAQKMSMTAMLWTVYDDIIVEEDFLFDLKIPLWDQKYVHVFLNDKTYDGIALIPKNADLSDREIKNRFYTNKKEVPIIASKPLPYDKFFIDTYDEYLIALNESNTDLFWMMSHNLKVKDNFNFDLYITYHNLYERQENHAFVHLVNEEKLFNGIFLLSKHKVVSRKEIEYRYLIERKEWDIVASGPCQYEIFQIENYKQYLDAMENSKTEMFWFVPSEVESLDNFKFDLYFEHSNVYDRQMNHSFKHLFRDEETHNGICLMSKKVPVSEKEINYRFIVDHKPWSIVASKVKPYDIIFISYNEIDADKNYEKLKILYPRAKRVHGVKGIHQAHIKAAELSSTSNFWVVDADAIILDSFKFDYEIPVYDRETVHVWQSKNPINNLVYGYGGVKLLPKQLTLDMDTSKTDMTTSISKNFKAIQSISNITAFNTDEFNTWKSAFRECAKLAGKTIDRQVDVETEDRLNIWCSQGLDKLYGKYAINGALAGREFAEENPQDLYKVNDFEWLHQHFIEKNRDH